MFTGIISEIGTLTCKNKSPNNDGTVQIEISCKKTAPKIGASISVNGACLTVTKRTKKGFLADVVEETLSLTTFGRLEIGARLNLEESLCVGDRLDGHFVSGHIDGVGKVLEIEKSKKGVILRVSLPAKLRKFIAKKGSVTINGVSLTVTDVSAKSISVAIIPFTLKNTNLGFIKAGDYVNLEADLLARYLIKNKNAPQRVRGIRFIASPSGSPV